MVYSDDHQPRHVHCFLEDAEIVVDLMENDSVALANRKDSIRPSNAKGSTVRKALTSVAKNYDQLAELWENIHGQA